MQNLAMTVEAYAPCQDVDIVSTGVESLAVAALLASRGRAVRFTNQDLSVPEQLLIRGESVSYKAGRLQPGIVNASADSSQRSAAVLLACAQASDYRTALNAVAEMLYPGQTVFIVDAPLGTAFELSCMVFKLRKRMAVNIIEMGPLFDECRFEGGSLEISGLRDQVAMCGRSVNETRSSLEIGRQLFTGLVPASNVLERGMSDSARILRSVARLYHVMRLIGKNSSGADSSKAAEERSLKLMETEIQALGKVYNVSVPEHGVIKQDFSDLIDREKLALAGAVSDTLVLLSDLAAVAYLPVPTIDSVIELASVALGRDLRRESRTLSDLGLVGMDVREIIELVNS